MSGVSGPDIAAVYQLLTEVARRVAGHDARLDGITAYLTDHDRKLDGIAAHLAEDDRKLDDLAAGLRSHALPFYGNRPRHPDQRARRARPPHRAPPEA